VACKKLNRGAEKGAVKINSFARPCLTSDSPGISPSPALAKVEIKPTKRNTKTNALEFSSVATLIFNDVFYSLFSKNETSAS
jgi:hypothetical protein